MNNFYSRKAVTKTRFSSPNLAINTFKWYNFQEDMKI